MVKRTGPTNEHLLTLIRKLGKDVKPIWKRVSRELVKPTRSRVTVNLSSINRNTKSGETIIIPGKVLGSGDLKHKLIIGAWQFSESAEKKIKEAGGSIMSINDLYAKGKIGRIIK